MSAAQGMIGSVDEALARVGQTLGQTEWIRVTQEMIDSFAKVTGDQQWIHVDPVRAADGPFGRCIAHGLLTLSLAGGRFFHDLVRTSAARGINYGSERVRYPAPVPAGSQVRGRAEFVQAQHLEGNAVQMTVRLTVDVEANTRPACVADFVVRYFF